MAIPHATRDGRGGPPARSVSSPAGSPFGFDNLSSRLERSWRRTTMLRRAIIRLAVSFFSPLLLLLQPPILLFFCSFSHAAFFIQSPPSESFNKVNQNRRPYLKSRVQSKSRRVPASWGLPNRIEVSPITGSSAPIFLWGGVDPRPAAQPRANTE